VDGLRNFQVTTGQDGVARARFHPNNTTGQYVINVTAMAAGVTARVQIRQSNAAGSGSSSVGATNNGLHLSTKTLLILTSVVVAGAVAGTVIATRGGGGTTVTPGTGTVGPPQ
jgi:hypothetical protein